MATKLEFPSLSASYSDILALGTECLEFHTAADKLKGKY
jgi:hypothetical protein